MELTKNQVIVMVSTLGVLLLELVPYEIGVRTEEKKTISKMQLMFVLPLIQVPIRDIEKEHEDLNKNFDFEAARLSSHFTGTQLHIRILKLGKRYSNFVSCALIDVQ